VFLAGAILVNPWFVALAVHVARSLLHRPGIAVPVPGRVLLAEAGYLAVTALLFVGAWSMGRAGRRPRAPDRPLVGKVALALFVIVVPCGWLELALRPFAHQPAETTSIFVRDDRLGWKLRPNTTDMWGGVEVHINERGFRGPVVPYDRTPGTRRVLYLGDSVTFGYKVANWQDTYPYLVGSLLAGRDSIPNETVNLAVEGYSQWQEYAVMSDEGYRYHPDLVVIGFVLNDVTEMFHLARFGGSSEGFQLRHTAATRLDRLLAHSALFYEIQRIAREVHARRQLGRDVRLGAIQREALEVETLMREPDQANVKDAWDIALADLQKIVDLCRSSQIRVLVVVFPFTSQLDDPTLGAPQRVITTYARGHSIPVIDLLPLLREHMRVSGLTASDLFVDNDHLSDEGHRVVAWLISDTVAALSR
jgi:lysophospholipase L1-like esterase